MYIYIYIDLSLYIYIYMYTSLSLSIHIYICIYIYIYMSLSLSLYIYIYIYIHILHTLRFCIFYVLELGLKLCVHRHYLLEGNLNLPFKPSVILNTCKSFLYFFLFDAGVAESLQTYNHCLPCIVLYYIILYCIILLYII